MAETGAGAIPFWLKIFFKEDYEYLEKFFSAVV